MQMVVVLGFVLVMVLEGVGSPLAPVGKGGIVISMVLGYVIGGYLFTKIIVLSVSRKMRRTGSHRGIGKACAILMIAVHVYLLAGIAGVMFAGWSDLVGERLHLAAIPLVEEMVLVSPFVLAVFLHWLAVYPLDRTVRNYVHEVSIIAGEPALPVWNRRKFLLFHIRYSLLFAAVPIGLIVLITDLMHLVEPALGSIPTMSMTVLGVGTVALFTPTILVYLWRARFLPDGALRRRLERMSRRVGFSFREIVVWDSAGVIVNAAVVGFIRHARYVLISDAMLEHFSDDAVAAVFAHEAGHAVHHHIPYTAIFSIGWFLLTVPLLQGLSAVMGASETVAEIAGASASAVLWVGVFGLLSRRFERQADLFAASIMSREFSPEPDGWEDQCPYRLNREGVRIFSAALQAVARLNGIEPSQRNFRHGSIRSRLEYLEEVLRTGSHPSADRNVRRIKAIIWVLFILGVIVTVFSVV